MEPSSLRKKLAAWGLLNAAAALAVYAAVVLLVSIGLLFNHTAYGWQAVLGLGSGVWLVYALGIRPFGLRLTLAALLGFCLFFAAACLASHFLTDFSWDGRNYHAYAVRMLREGWNPVYELAGDHAAWTMYIWLDHFAKAPWYFSAALVEFTGSLEVGKVSSLLLGWAAFGLSAWFLLTYTALPGPFVGLASGLVSLNPVLAVQFASRYTDGQVGAIFTVVLLLSLAELASRRGFAQPPGRLFLLAWGAALVLGINIKFTSAVYTGGLLAALGLGLLWQGRFKALLPRLGWWAAVCLVGILVTGYSPYVRNTLEYGHPLYPTFGSEGKVEDFSIQMRLNAPPGFSENPPVHNLWVSLASPSMNYNTNPDDTPIKVPFTFTRAEFAAFTSTDVRLGGFGPLFSGALVLALAGLALVRLPRAQAWGWGWALALTAGLTLANPESWWARYVPQFWLFPLGVACGLLLSADPPWLLPFIKNSTRVGWLRRLVGWGILGVLLANSLGVGGISLDRTIQSTRAARQVFASLAASGEEIMLYRGMMLSTEETLAAYGIPFQLVRTLEELPCEPQFLTPGVTYSLAICPP